MAVRLAWHWRDAEPVRFRLRVQVVTPPSSVDDNQGDTDRNNANPQPGCTNARNEQDGSDKQQCNRDPKNRPHGLPFIAHSKDLPFGPSLLGPFVTIDCDQSVQKHLKPPADPQAKPLVPNGRSSRPIG